MKKVNYKDESDEPKSVRLSSRLSIFRGGQDAGSSGTRSPAKALIRKGMVVQTFMGPATVKNVRSEDGMSEVSLSIPRATKKQCTSWTSY